MILGSSAYDPDWKTKRDQWIGYWIGIVCIVAIFTAIERSSIGVAGENLTLDVRKDLVSAILHKQLSWFDRESRAPGVLTKVLSEDISTLNGMTSETIIVIIEATLGLVGGVVLGLYVSW